MASCERVASAPTWRGLWKQVWRYILPALGFYEWQAITDSAGRAAKLPWYIRIGDQLVFGMVGLWDVSIKEDGTRVESCAVIAVPVHKVMDVIDGTVAKTAGSHDGRMPVILTRAAQEARLRGSPADAEACLKPYDDELTIAHRVSSRVNSPRNNDEKLIEEAASGPV